MVPWVAAMRPTPILAAALLSGACAIYRPPVEEILAPRPGDEPSEDEVAAYGAALLTDLDAAARDARGAAAEEASNAETQVHAARALYEAADARILVALLDVLAETDPAGARAVLDAEWTVRDDLAGEVLSLAEDGLAHAERALALETGHPEALLWRGVHLALVSFGLGPVRAAVSGRGADAWFAVEDARGACGPGFLGAAPLRLEGRVLTQVPWPWRDPPRAARRLDEATRLAPTPVNHLYHGDALFEDEREGEAVGAWRAARAAQADSFTAYAAPLHRALARVRLEASGADAQ